ncbi:MAG TPA: transposase, partial [Cyanobacteria bacterium UBA12227]|nr:transposase [Cyanobacteria bacterium UBA12227]
EQGIEQGRQEGKIQGQIELILRQLERRLGTISPDIQTRIRQLSSEQLENLGDTMIEFRTASDLIGWLENQPLI